MKESKYIMLYTSEFNRYIITNEKRSISICFLNISMEMKVMGKKFMEKCKSKYGVLLSLFVLTLMLGTFIISPSTSFASESAQSGLGTWQMIVDGQNGEGSLFFRLEFKEEGKLTLTQQAGEINTSEEKVYTLEEGNLNISSNDGDLILMFDNASIKMIDDTSMSYEKGNYKSVIKIYNSSIAWIHWILTLVVLIALNELFRRMKYSAFIFYIALPILLLPVWLKNDVTYWFKWVKVYSVVFACIWFTFMRFTKLHKANYAKLIAALFLAVNISEAVMQDFSMGRLPNILNGLAGVLSIITLFYGWKGISADRSKEKDMVWPLMSVLWILAYDVWNWVFVYLNFPGSASLQFMVILSCTIPALFIKKGTWLQARAYTLAVWFMYYFTFPRFTESVEIMVPRNTSLMIGVAVVSIILNGACFYVFVRNKKAKLDKLAVAV